MVLLSFAVLGQAVAAANPVVVQSVTRAEPSEGNSGARILNINYSDGMTVVVATYNSFARRSDRSPIGIIAGYGMDISYLHYMAEILSRIGYPVYLVRPPGNGQGRLRSGLPRGNDGYHNTIEGFATMYMDGLGQAMADAFGGRTVLLGHSRGGYQIRVFLSGLRVTGYDSAGKPVLEYSESAMQLANRNFLAVAALFSPLRPDARLVEAARKVAEGMERAQRLDLLSQRLKTQIPRQVGSAVHVLTRINPLAILAGPVLGRIAAEINERVFSSLAAGAIDREAKYVEERFMSRFLDIVTDQADLSPTDLKMIGIMRRAFGAELVPSDSEIVADIQRVRWMLGDADIAALRHTLTHASKQGPSPLAAAEMRRITDNHSGLSSWLTMGVSPDGKPLSLVRALIRACQTESALPYAVFAASGDGVDQGEAVEEKLLNAQIFRVKGSHAATLNSGSVELVSRILSDVSESKRAIARGCVQLFRKIQ